MISDIKERVPMQALLERYGIQLDRKGKALCPFHKEKTPSFGLYGQRFHCFGCGASGDIFDFVMMQEGISLPAAMEKIDTLFGLGLQGRKMTVRQRQNLREEERRRKAARKIEEKKEEKWKSAYFECADRFREAEKDVADLSPKTMEEPLSDAFADAVSRLFYAEIEMEEMEKEREKDVRQS